ncbi:UNVERIFIED_CONTAM: hypothetical protein GTU68_066743 [Idotea baltica]|nr:hypothetical protein [Idotea baltica]
MTSLGLDRHALIINVGGGVVTDLGGFCAATYKRGVDFIQIPTSLLAMVDAAIGGKTGVDFFRYKNQIGVFAEPIGTWIEPTFLETLPAQEWVSGYAEIYKHALINSRDLFNRLNKLTLIDPNLDWAEIIWQAIDIKDQIVQRDPLEKGDRKALNYGHTIGHAIESLRLEQGAPIPHGWAVAMGVLCESYLSTAAGYLTQVDLDMIGRHIMQIFDCQRLMRDDYEAIYAYCLGDKKNRNGQILCTLIGPVGDFSINQPIDADQIYSALDYYNGIVSDYA